MKILFLNPRVDAQHKILVALQAKSDAVLLPETAEEAWQVLQLHGTSIELAIIHREGRQTIETDSGLSLIERIKKDPAQADLPIILTSEAWGQEEFTAHQNGEFGVHAYLKWPCEEADIHRTLDEMFGPTPNKTPVDTGRAELSDGPVLEEASALLLKPERESEKSEIRLDAPSTPDGESIPSPQGTEAEQEVSSMALAELSLAGLELPQMTGSASAPIAPIAQVPPPANIPDLEQFLVPAPSPGIPDSLPLVDPTRNTESRELLHQASPPEAEPAPAPIVQSTFGMPQDSPPPVPTNEEIDRAILSEMPYLFTQKNPFNQAAPSSSMAQRSNAGLIVPPMGNAIIPGGVSQTPDEETLKKYLVLREQDVAVLASQLQAALDRISQLETELRVEQSKCNDLNMLCNTQQERIDLFEKEKALALENAITECAELRFEIKTKGDKAKILESQVREATQEMDRLKERVRADIRRIRIREKELENKLEITRKDSEVLIGTRETKIIELKRKLDILEFNMDLLQDQFAKEKEVSSKLRERLSKAAQVVRVAGGFLDAQGIPIPNLELPDDEPAPAKSSEPSAMRKAG